MFTIGYDQSENMFTIGSNTAKVLRSSDSVRVNINSKIKTFKVLAATIVDKVMVVTSMRGEVYLCRIINNNQAL